MRKKIKPLFLIPARGGSKGVPGKNIKLLGGKPLISHSIQHGLAVADTAADVVVTTDSEEIARVAEDAGATVPFLRPAELATDTAGSREVMLHAVDTLAAKGKEYDTIVLLQPTSPLRNPEDIRKAIELFERERPDMVVSVSEARTNPYYNGFETDETGCLHISKGDGRYTRRQDAPPVWEFNGAIYVIDVEALRNVKSLAELPRIMPLPIAPETAVDIDSPIDFIIAEAMMTGDK